jgi:hypothetical protein
VIACLPRSSPRVARREDEFIGFRGEDAVIARKFVPALDGNFSRPQIAKVLNWAKAWSTRGNFNEGKMVDNFNDVLLIKKDGTTEVFASH